ncbi:MAG: hypothetical protein WC471_03015 [Candidatus Woesearchaeota archaeon]
MKLFSMDLRMETNEEDCKIGLFYKIPAGMNIGIAIMKMHDLVKKYDCKVFAVFNGWLPLVLSPGEDLQKVNEEIDEALHRHEEYLRMKG